MTDCPSSLPSAFSTATEMVSRWTSRPIYLMLSIGCSFREVSLLLQHSNPNLLRKGRPFIMRAPSFPLFWERVGTEISTPSRFVRCPTYWESQNTVTVLRFVITSEARDLLSAAACQKQIPRARHPGARNDNTQRGLALFVVCVSL